MQAVSLNLTFEPKKKQQKARSKPEPTTASGGPPPFSMADLTPHRIVSRKLPLLPDFPVKLISPAQQDAAKGRRVRTGPDTNRQAAMSFPSGRTGNTFRHSLPSPRFSTAPKPHSAEPYRNVTVAAEYGAGAARQSRTRPYRQAAMSIPGGRTGVPFRHTLPSPRFSTAPKPHSAEPYRNVTSCPLHHLTSAQQNDILLLQSSSI